MSREISAMCTGKVCASPAPLWQSWIAVVVLDHCGSPGPLWQSWTTVAVLDHCGSPGPLWQSRTTVAVPDHCGSPGPLWQSWTTVAVLDHCGRPGPLWQSWTTVAVLETSWFGIKHIPNFHGSGIYQFFCENNSKKIFAMGHTHFPMQLCVKCRQWSATWNPYSSVKY